MEVRRAFSTLSNKGGILIGTLVLVFLISTKSLIHYKSARQFLEIEKLKVQTSKRDLEINNQLINRLIGYEKNQVADQVIKDPIYRLTHEESSYIIRKEGPDWGKLIKRADYYYEEDSRITFIDTNNKSEVYIVVIGNLDLGEILRIRGKDAKVFVVSTGVVEVGEIVKDGSVEVVVHADRVIGSTSISCEFYVNREGHMCEWNGRDDVVNPKFKVLGRY